MRTHGAQSFKDEDLNTLTALSTPRMPATALSVQLLDCLGLLWGCLPQCCSQEVLSLACGDLTLGDGGGSADGGDHTK